MNKKEYFIINNRKYSWDELNWIWNYFKENGVPTATPYGLQIAKPLQLAKPSGPASDELRGYKEFEQVVYSCEHLDVERLAIMYKGLYDAYRKVCAELELKDRKPLTKAQFDSKAYKDYLKAFDEETKRLKKEAGIEEL